MKHCDTLSSNIGQAIFGGKVTELCVKHPAYVTAAVCFVFSMLLVFSVKRSNRRRL